MLITLEGIDGAGKSTQVAPLAAVLEAEGLRAVVTREPGATPLGRELRRLLLESEVPLAPDTELLLFLADRAEHVSRVIVPALAAGAAVVCDRFCDSTVAYQGWGRGRDVARVRRWDAESRGDVHPDLTLLLDCPIEVAAARVGAARADRYQRLAPDFHHRVREGFLALAAEEPARVRRIDAGAGVDAVRDEIAGIVRAFLAGRRRGAAAR